MPEFVKPAPRAYHMYKSYTLFNEWHDHLGKNRKRTANGFMYMHEASCIYMIHTSHTMIQMHMHVYCRNVCIDDVGLLQR